MSKRGILPLLDCVQGKHLKGMRLRKGLEVELDQLLIGPRHTSVLHNKNPTVLHPPNPLASHCFYSTGFIPRVEVVVSGDGIAPFFRSGTLSG